MSKDLMYILEQLAIWFGLFIGLLAVALALGAVILYILGTKLDANDHKENNASQARR